MIEARKALLDALEALSDEFSKASTQIGLEYLDSLFSLGADAPGSQLAAAAVRGIGHEAFIAQSIAQLAKELLSRF